MLWKHIRQKSLVEFVVLLMGGLGVVLLVAPFHITATVGRLGEWSGAIAQSFVQNLRQLTPYHALGLLLLIASIVLVLDRIRYRLRTNEQLTSLKCPKCGSEIRRSHRRSFDFLMCYFVPVLRYRCRNRECGWRGLRIKSLS